MLIIRLWREEIKYGKPHTGLLKNRTVFIVWEHFWWFFHPVSSEVTIHGSHLRPHNSSDPTTFSMRVSLLCSSVVLLCFSLSRVCVCAFQNSPRERSYPSTWASSVGQPLHQDLSELLAGPDHRAAELGPTGIWCQHQMQVGYGIFNLLLATSTSHKKVKQLWQDLI